MKNCVVVLLLLLALPALAQGIDPLRNVAGTAGSPGVEPWVRSGSGGWTFFHGFDVHATYVSETGPSEQRNDVFSTNWFAAGAQRDFGRGFVLLRGRVSLEPYTIPNEGYPQMLQYVPDEISGPGSLVDHMRAHDLLGEAAVQIGWRPTRASLLHVYAAAVGDPALGAPPAQLRASGIDFAEAPFAYDIQETFHDSTSVVTAGFATSLVTIEASVFHDAFTTGRHTTLDNGDIDSQSARITLTPGENFAIQYSQGELGEGSAQRDVSSASVSYGNKVVAATALWTRTERTFGDPLTAYGFEVALRGTRNTFMGRAEWVDRPAGFPVLPEHDPRIAEQTTHFAVGYIFDFVTAAKYRVGAGLNIDYHTQSHDLPASYGHKPQSIYAFLRVRN